MNEAQFIQLAINYGYRNIGATAENPSVGAIIAKDGRLIAAASTAIGGRPHAEHTAIEKAGDMAYNSDLYVTLEPCCHHGNTPPCVEKIIQAGIKNVIIGSLDPDPRISGKGIAMLQDAGIKVKLLESNLTAKLHEGFFSRINKNRPFITLKLAVSLDGKIALHNYSSKWISGELSRNYTHLLRAKNDAIMVGANSFKYDNPSLDCRIKGLGDKSPKKIIIPSGKHDLLQNIRNINNLLVEGGGKIAASLLKSQLVDRLILCRAAIIIGDDGIGAFHDLNIQDLSLANRFKLVEFIKLEPDMVEIYEPIKNY